MTFELALVVIVALVAVALGLVCYHLLGRLEMLERSVQGGLEPPSTRLSREQFERRFKTAHARSELARTVDTGVVLVVGPEYAADSELAGTVQHLARPDLFELRQASDMAVDELGITTTPFLFIIDERNVRTAQPLASSDDLIAALRTFA